MMLIYKMCHDTLTYRKNFNITLMMLAIITTVLLALIQNNPLLSLGVLGSLSICRIRSNTKNPRYLGLVFLALSIGIRRCLYSCDYEFSYHCNLIVYLLSKESEQ